ncbi:hypothetical protein ABH926_007969 [Catenulispora sp. GP43]|uniref:hypothetical protein n=1 Tax=Catenulispora sp. GP43 TaxID=3156263 RepID=UPI0035156B50
MAEKWAAMSKGARILLVAVLLYVVEAVLTVATDADTNNGYASVLIGAVTSTFGTFLAVAALRTDYLAGLRLRWRLRSGAESATATVAAVVSFYNSDFTYPVFEYATPDGATHRHADASSRMLEVGATAEVRYVPAEADFAVGPIGRFNVVVFAVLAALGAVLLVMMPLMTVQALFS